MEESKLRTAKPFKFRLLLVVGLFVLGNLFVIAQQSQNQKITDRQKMIERQREEQAQMFWKFSSTRVAADEGNRIVAIRPVSFIFDDRNAQGLSFRNNKQMVEIEIFSRVKIPVTNSMQYAVVGDKLFPEPKRSGDLNTVFVYFEMKEFEELKDGSLVSYMILPVMLGKDSMKEVYKNGEPKEISGAKFGRIDKKMINRFPIIEEDSKTNLLRISRNKNTMK